MANKLTREELEKIVKEIISNEESGIDMTNDLGVSSPFKKQRKSLKTPIEKLNNYNLIVGDSVFWASRQVYLKLIQSFLSREIDGETLTSRFFQLRIQDIMRTDELCAIIEDQILPIPDLYYTFKAKDFSCAIDELYLEIDLYDPDLEDSDWNDYVYSESKLRSVIQKSYVPILQKSCDLDDSFFKSKIDLDQLVKRSYQILFSVSLGISGLLLVKLF